MAFSLDSEYRSIADDLTKLWRSEIKRQGHYKSGRLYNSIKWSSSKTSEGYRLSMKAEDYYSELDKKFNITAIIKETGEYKRIQERIGFVYSLYIQEYLTDGL